MSGDAVAKLALMRGSASGIGVCEVDGRCCEIGRKGEAAPTGGVWTAEALLELGVICFTVPSE